MTTAQCDDENRGLPVLQKYKARVLACPVVIDLYNVYDPDELTSRGFLYQASGEPESQRSSPGLLRSARPAES